MTGSLNNPSGGGAGKSWGDHASDIVPKVFTGISARGSATNAENSSHKRRQDNVKLQVDSQNAVEAGTMTGGQFMKASGLSGMSLDETEEIMRDAGVMHPGETLKDIHRGPFNSELPCAIPYVTQEERTLILEPDKAIPPSSNPPELPGSSGTPLGKRRARPKLPDASEPSPGKRRARPRSESTPEQLPPSSDTNEMISSDETMIQHNQQEHEISGKEAGNDIILGAEDYHVVPDSDLAINTQGSEMDLNLADTQGSEMNLNLADTQGSEMDLNPFNSTDPVNAVFASASLGGRPSVHVPKEVYSVPRSNPAWVTSFTSIVSLGLLYMVFFPLADIGSQYMRKLLSRFYPKTKDSANNSALSVNSAENSYINVPETITRFNKGELTYEQADLLLGKVTVFSKADREKLLKRKNSNSI